MRPIAREVRVETKRFDNVEDFYERAKGFLLAREAEHNLILGICGHLRQHPEEAGRAYMAVVEERGAP